MSSYAISCKISGLRPLHTDLLEQAGCRVLDKVLAFELSREQAESNDEFHDRATRWVDRELSRLNVLTGNLLKAGHLSFEPPIGATTGLIHAAFGHAPQVPPSHAGWLKKGVEFRAKAWDIASRTEDVVLCFVMLDSICESAEVPQEWSDRKVLPQRFAEVRLIRNLIVHGSEDPKPEIIDYLRMTMVSGSHNRLTDRHKHLEFARLRAPHLVAAVWRVVLNGCVLGGVAMFSDQPASWKRTLVIEDQGPYPYEGERKGYFCAD